MPLTMDQLGEFMQLGPQVYKERPNGALVTQRGPHGAWFAADPVRTREAKERGSGFRFWVEDMNVSPGQAWEPGVQVVSLLGLGDQQKQEASNEVKKSLSARASRLAAYARTASVEKLNELIVAPANDLEAELNRYFPWKQKTMGEQAAGWFSTERLLAYAVTGGWDSSQTVRSNIQLARFTARRRSSGAEIRPGTSAPVKSVDVYEETAKELPGAVKDEAVGWADAAVKAVKDAAGQVISEHGPKIAGVVVLLAAGSVAYMFASTAGATAGRKLAEKIGKEG